MGISPLAALSLGLAALVLACGEPPALTKTPELSLSPQPSSPLPAGSAPKPESPQGPKVLAILPNAPCVIEGKGHLAKPLKVLAKGKHYLTVTDVEWIEAHVGPSGGATVVGRTQRVDFVGEVPLADLRVVPRARRTGDRGVVVTLMTAREITASGEIVGTSQLPPVLNGTKIESKLRCDEVTLETPRWVWEVSGKTRELRQGAKGSMREAPGGAILSTIDVPKAPPPNAPVWVTQVLEERGAIAKMAIRSEDTLVEGWVETSMTAPLSRDAAASLLSIQAESLQLQMLAALGGRPEATKPTCSDALPIYVLAEGAPLVVGALRPGNEVPPLQATSASNTTVDEVAIELGGAKGPFVAASDLRSRCDGSERTEWLAVRRRGLVQGPKSSFALGPATVPAASGGSEGKVRGLTGEVFVGGHSATIPSPDADRVLARARPRFRSCHQAGLASNPTSTGRVVLGLKVAPSGEVTSATADQNSGLSPSVLSCVEAVGRRLQFSQTPQGTVLRVPLMFTSLN